MSSTGTKGKGLDPLERYSDVRAQYFIVLRDKVKAGEVPPFRHCEKLKKQPRTVEELP